MRFVPVAVAALLTLSSPSLALQPPGQAVRLERSIGGLPVLTVQLGGKSLRLALDTGTSRSMIAAVSAERLGLVPRAQFAVVAAAGPARTALCAGPLELRVGAVPLRVDCLGWVPGERRLAGAEDVDGLLGADALAGVDLWIDLDRGRARLAAAGSLAPWVEGERLAVDRFERRAAVTVAIAAVGGASAPARLVIDSGANRTLLFGELAQRVLRARPTATGIARLTTAAGSNALTVLLLREVRVGRMRVEPGLAGLLPEVADRGEDGLLPIGSLGPILLDLAGGTLVVGARFRSRPDAPPPL